MTSRNCHVQGTKLPSDGYRGGLLRLGEASQRFGPTRTDGIQSYAGLVT